MLAGSSAGRACVIFRSLQDITQQPQSLKHCRPCHHGGQHETGLRCLAVVRLKLQDLHEELPCMLILPVNAGGGTASYTAQPAGQHEWQASSVAKLPESVAKRASGTVLSTHAQENKVSTLADSDCAPQHLLPIFIHLRPWHLWDLVCEPSRT